MRMIARFMYAGGGNEVAFFNSPCDGFFSNITVKMFASGNLNHTWSFGDINQDNFFLQVANQTPSIGRGNSRTFWAGSTVLDYNTTIADVEGIVWNRATPLHVKRSEDIGFAIDSLDSITTVVVIEADFVPYDGAEFAYLINFDDWSDSATWTDHNLLMPQMLRDAYIEIKGQYTDTAAYQGAVYMRMASPRNPIGLTTFTTNEYGIINGAPSNDEAMALGNMKVIHLSVPAGELTQFIDDAFIPDKQRIYHGNVLQFEARKAGGDALDAGQMHLSFIIRGKAVQSNRRALKANYYSGLTIINHTQGRY